MNTKETETTKQKPKIAAIYPLNAVQEQLLFHHLSADEDKGYLAVKCTLEGQIDTVVFQEAWKAVVQSHEVMRTSVHWKNIDNPVLIVRPQKDINFTYCDWSDIDSNDLNQRKIQLRQEHKETGIILDKSPLSHITLCKTADTSYYLHWDCHHLLLDGWSSSIILQDVLSIYNQLINNTPIITKRVPVLKDYKDWIKQQDTAGIAQFWNGVFKDYQGMPLFGQAGNPIPKPFVSFDNTFSITQTSQANELARQLRITPNTLLQGIWSLVLMSHFENKQVLFGTTVSGRSGDFAHIERLTGMLANVLPVYVSDSNTISVATLLENLQQQQQEARQQEHISIEQINNWLDPNTPLIQFDSLFIYENFPWKSNPDSSLQLTHFESGITSTYPVTLTITAEDQIRCNLLVDHSVIDEQQAQWLLGTFEGILDHLWESKDTKVATITELFPSIAPQKETITDLEERITQTIYTAPKNETELKLVGIWEQLFDANFIGTSDNFFELGGKSFLAVRMFKRIQDELGVKLPPSTLLEHATIEALASILHKGSDQQQWKNLVPIKSSGSKRPLFCIHAGGAHVFFFKPLADAMDREIPVYALQPTGIYSEDTVHQSVDDMARDYADEVMTVQPEGTINLMVYCFSSAVGLAMATYLRTKGRTAHIIVMDTMPEHDELFNKDRFRIRMIGFLERLLRNPFKAIGLFVKSFYKHRVAPIQKKAFGNDEIKKTEEMRLHLVKLFNAYHWQGSIDNITLLVTPKPNSVFNASLERSWDAFVNNPTVIVYSKHQHGDLFIAPHIEDTAQQIGDVIKT